MAEETVVFDNRAGRKIVGTLALPEGAPERIPGVLVVHGFRGNRRERHIAAVAQALTWAGCATLRVDLTNNLGDSEGEFRHMTVSGAISDAQDAIAWLAASEHVDGERLGITGHSLGGLVAAVAASVEASIRAVVCLSAVFEMAPKLAKRLGAEQIVRWQEQGWIELDPPGSGVVLDYGFYEDLLKIEVAGALQRLRAPLRVVQGEADSGVTMEDARQIHDLAGSSRKELVAIPSADHTYTQDADLMKVCLYTADWFRQELRP